MKNHTDLEQSKKLTKILSDETADFFWLIGHLHTDGPKYQVIRTRNEVSEPETCWPCWSLAALMNVLPSATLDSSDDHYYRVHCKERFTDWYDNPIDACVAMIDRLHREMIHNFNNS